MLHPTTRDFAAAPAAEQAATSAPAAGLIVLGLNIILLSLYYADFFPFPATVLGMGLFYGALGQIAAGLSAWRKRHALGTVVGVAFGLFWLSQIALVVLPATGFGRPPQPAALSSYFVMWGLFATILFSGAGRLGRELQVFLAMFGIFLLLLAIGAALESPLLNAMAGGEGIACGLAAIYAGIAQRMCGEVKRSLDGFVG